MKIEVGSIGARKISFRRTFYSRLRIDVLSKIGDKSVDSKRLEVIKKHDRIALFVTLFYLGYLSGRSPIFTYINVVEF